jgi:membrane fusion protein (multidrug efflux system)
VTLAQGNLAEVRLLRDDGTLYDEKGTLDFSDYSVNPPPARSRSAAGCPILAACCLPGMYVKVRLSVGTLKKGFRVPQLAVQRDGQGPFVLVAGADGMVAQKRIVTTSAVGNDWVISSGLADGDQVIVDNLQKIGPGMPVKAKAAKADGAAAPAVPAAVAEGSAPATAS